MNRRFSTSIVVVVAIIGAVYYAFSRHQDSKDIVAKGNDPPQVNGGKANVGPRAGTPAQLEPPTPMPAVIVAPAIERPAPRALTLADIKQPPEGTPVRDVLAALRDAADQGIPQAACRLGVELVRCSRTRFNLIQLGEMQAAAARAPKNSAEASRLMQDVGARQRSLGEDQRACNGVPDEVSSEAWRYIYSAAAAGNVAAMSRFARDPGLLPSDSSAAEGWSAFRKDAPDFLAGAIKGGDVRALYQGRFSAMSGQSIAGPNVFSREPDKALQYGTAILNLFDASRAAQVTAANERIAQEIGPERAEVARQAGAKLRDSTFANAKPQNWGNDDGATDVADCWK